MVEHSAAVYFWEKDITIKETSSKIARFTVSLAEGMNLLLAVAGPCKDSAVIEKVDAEPEIYALPGNT